MACNRCGAALASDMAKVKATFRTPSGAPLYVSIIISATADALRLRPEMFCEPCWVSFLELFHQIGEASRIVDVQARPS